MKTRCLCSFCVNHLFAKVSWFKYISIFNGCHLSNDAFMLLCSLLNIDLFEHPKAYKMMPKSCQLYNKWDNKSEHAFRTMIEFNFLRIEGGIGHHPGDYRDKAAVYCISWLFLSIKYWNQFQLLCFVKDYWLELKAMALVIFRRREIICKSCEKVIVKKDEQRDEPAAAMLKCILLETFSRIESIRSIPKHIRIAHTKSKWLKQCDFGSFGRKQYIRKVIRLRNQSFVECGYYGCHSTEESSSRPFKICSGCKIVYFCSRRCQKKAWKIGHRQTCEALRLKYCL